jgi:hypothetical protein
VPLCNWELVSDAHQETTMIFFRWWILVSAVLIGAFLSSLWGLPALVWGFDQTMLGAVCVAIFAVITVFVGWLSWTATSARIQQHAPLCWFTSELVLGIGMLGTLIGFMIMISGLFVPGADFGSAAHLQVTLANMAAGFATAAVTTIVGLTCSLLIKLQLINLEYALEQHS